MSASRDGEDWQIIGTLGREGSVSCEVPPAMLPADEIWVRFTVRSAAGETQPPALQLHGYHYEADVDGPSTEAIGARDSSRYSSPIHDCKYGDQHRRR